MRGRWLRRVGPWLTPALVVAEVALASSGLLPLREAVASAVAVELALWVVVAARVVAGARRFRSARRGGADAWRAAEDALAAVVPRSFARVILLEPRLWACLVRWAIRRHAGVSSASLTYHRQVRGLMGVAAALVAVEGAVADVLLFVLLPGSAWRWAVLGAHVYALVVVGGLHASFATRPHLVVDGNLVVRDGIFHEIVIPLGAITTARRERRANSGRSGLRCDPGTRGATVALGDATVALGIDPAATVAVDGVRLRPRVANLAITVDEPDLLLAALDRGTARRGGRTPPEPGRDAVGRGAAP